MIPICFNVVHFSSRIKLPLIIKLGPNKAWEESVRLENFLMQRECKENHKSATRCNDVWNIFICSGKLVNCSLEEANADYFWLKWHFLLGEFRTLSDESGISCDKHQINVIVETKSPRYCVRISDAVGVVSRTEVMTWTNDRSLGSAGNSAKSWRQRCSAETQNCWSTNCSDALPERFESSHFLFWWPILSWIHPVVLDISKDVKTTGVIRDINLNKWIGWVNNKKGQRCEVLPIMLAVSEGKRCRAHPASLYMGLCVDSTLRSLTHSWCKYGTMLWMNVTETAPHRESALLGNDTTSQ